jgi:23S rRNA pseudouridine2604 synthase
MKKDLLGENTGREDMRLNKYLSDAGYCSRREADRLISEGKVTVDGKTAQTGMRVTGDQLVKVCGKTVSRGDELVLIALNKPRGIVCTTDRRREKNNIVDYMKYPVRIYPVGRLDKDSEGLILLTNDGSIVNHILKARTFHEKEYIVTVDKALTDDFLKDMAGGVSLEETVTRPCKVKKISDHTFSIILTQGLNRQIRRMCAALGYKVVRLKRIRIMNIRLGSLKTGRWRHVTAEEIEELKKAFLEDRDG